MSFETRWIKLVAVLVLAAMLAVACGAPAATEEPQEEPCKAAILLPSTISDEGYSAAGYEGLLAIGDTFGCETAYSEVVPLAEMEETFRDYASQGYDIIVGHGYEYGDPIEVVAPEFPDTAFISINGDVTGPNYSSLSPTLKEASYVAGYIAARMSETGKVGAVGGYALPDVVNWLEAYRLGAELANPDVEVPIAYTDSWDDLALCKEAALAQIDTGADTVFHIANACGLGAIQACEESGVWAIGFCFDQHDLAPDYVTTSTEIDYAEMMVQAARGIFDDTFDFTVIHHYGLASGAVKLSPYYGLVPDDIAAEAEDLQQQIIDGEVEIPDIWEPTQ
jgi:basic membrane protein A